MYPVSNAFLNAVKANTRKYYWTGKITTTAGTVINFDQEDMVKGSGYITSQCCGSTEIELAMMKYSENSKPITCMMTQSTCYKGTGKMQVKGVLWHSTGVNNPNLKRYVQPDDNAADRDAMIKLLGKNSFGNDWNHTKVQAGLNAWIGKLADGTVATVQTMSIWKTSGMRCNCRNTYRNSLRCAFKNFKLSY